MDLNFTIEKRKPGTKKDPSLAIIKKMDSYLCYHFGLKSKIYKGHKG